jgi:hypothetical protein
MTCIVGIAEKGKIYLGGDAITVSGHYDKTISRAPKVFIRGPMVFGACHSIRMRNLLQYRLDIPIYRGDDLMTYLVNDFIDAVRDCFKRGGLAQEEKGREEGGKFLLGFQGQLFCVELEYDILVPSTPYYAIGCGDNIAFGSLYSTEQLNMDPMRRLELALHAAERHNTDVSGPFTFVTDQEGIDQVEVKEVALPV